MLTFSALLRIVHADLIERRDNGEFTERGLASLTGFSQPHIHHILSGARALTPAVADELLKGLGISLWDLITAHSGKWPA